MPPSTARPATIAGTAVITAADQRAEDDEADEEADDDAGEVEPELVADQDVDDPGPHRREAGDGRL